MLHWKRLAWLSMQDFLQWSIMIITIAGSIVAFLPTKDVIWLRAAIPYYASTYWWWAVLLLLLVMGLAVLRNWPRTRAVYKDKKTDIWVIIECCDLLQQKGLKVVLDTSSLTGTHVESGTSFLFNVITKDLNNW
jgi:hypothetical protein